MSQLEDEILKEIKTQGFFPIHNGHAPTVYPALRKLKAWGIIEPNLNNTKYTFTKEGDILMDSGKSFDEWIHPKWYTKIWNFFKKGFWPAILLTLRKYFGS